MNQVRLKTVITKAQDLLQELGINALPVDPFVIAEKRAIEVQPKSHMAAGVSGMLLRHGNEFGILYATHIRNEGFQRFSIAHELGHYFLDGHMDHVLPTDGSHSSSAGFVSRDLYEIEADQFAAGLLMPNDLFWEALQQHEANIADIGSLASLCKTSLTATAVRYAALTDDAVAVIVSTGNKIDYCCLSNTMKSLKEITWPTKGMALPPASVTAQFNSRPDRVSKNEKDEAEIEISDWIGGSRSLTAIEEVIGLGNYGKTLTLLTCSSLVEETYRDENDEEEDDASFRERWTPQFRR